MMKRLVIPSMMVVLVVALLFAGCAAPAAPTTPTAPTAPTTPTAPTEPTAPTTPTEPASDPLNPFGKDFAVKPDGTPMRAVLTIIHVGGAWSAFAGHIWEEYMDRVGANYSLHDAQKDAGNMLADMEDFLVMEPDMVFIQAVDGKAAVPPTEALVNAGIPVFGWDVLPETDNITATVNHTDAALGTTAGEFAIAEFERLGKPGKVYTCQGMLSMSQTIQRHAAFLEAIEGSNVQAVAECEASWSDENCLHCIEAAFTADPELNAIFTHGGMLNGAVEALRGMGKLYPVGDPNHIVCVTIDEGEATCQIIKDGYGDAVSKHSPWDDVDYMVKTALWYVVCGQPVTQKHLEQGTYPITHDMIVADLEKDLPLFWGDCLLKGISYDQMPVLDNQYVDTPTLADRMSLMGY